MCVCMCLRVKAAVHTASRPGGENLTQHQLRRGSDMTIGGRQRSSACVHGSCASLCICHLWPLFLYLISSQYLIVFLLSGLIPLLFIVVCKRNIKGPALTWSDGFLAWSLCSSWPQSQTSFLPASQHPRSTSNPAEEKKKKEALNVSVCMCITAEK